MLTSLASNLLIRTIAFLSFALFGTIVSAAVIYKELLLLEPIRIFAPGMFIPNYVITAGGIVLFLNIILLLFASVQERKSIMILTKNVTFILLFATVGCFVIGLCFYILTRTSIFQTQMENAVANYRHAAWWSEMMDEIQTSLKCCGIHGPQDYREANENITFFLDIYCRIPESCCANENCISKLMPCENERMRKEFEDDVKKTIQIQIYYEGCLEKAIVHFDQVEVIILVYTALLIVMQMVTLWVNRNLLNKIKINRRYVGSGQERAYGNESLCGCDACKFENFPEGHPSEFMTETQI